MLQNLTILQTMTHIFLNGPLSSNYLRTEKSMNTCYKTGHNLTQ